MFDISVAVLQAEMIVVGFLKLFDCSEDFQGIGLLTWYEGLQGIGLLDDVSEAQGNGLAGGDLNIVEDDESFSNQDDSEKDPGQASSETGSPSASEDSYIGGVFRCSNGDGPPTRVRVLNSVSNGDHPI